MLYVLFLLMVPGTRHVRHGRRQGFYLPHKLVTNECVLRIHVVCKVSNVQDYIEVRALGFVLQVR